MLHLQDLLGIAVALAVILVMLLPGNLLGSDSLFRRTLTAPGRVIGKALRTEPPARI